MCGCGCGCTCKNNNNNNNQNSLCKQIQRSRCTNKYITHPSPLTSPHPSHSNYNKGPFAAWVIPQEASSPASFSCLRFSTDQQLLLAVVETRIYLLDAFTGEVKTTLRTDTVEDATLERDVGMTFEASFSPCGQYVSSGCEDRVVRTWSAKTGQLVGQLSSHAGAWLSAWAGEGVGWEEGVYVGVFVGICGCLCRDGCLGRRQSTGNGVVPWVQMFQHTNTPHTPDTPRSTPVLQVGPSEGPAGVCM